MPSSDRQSILGLWARLLAFSAPLLAGWLFLEWGMGRVPTSHSVKRDRLAALAGEVETVILGSSEAYYGIVPKRLTGSAFSLANSSQSLYYDDALIEHLLPRLPRLRRVIVPISYFTLYFQLYDHEESWRQYQYAQVWGLPLQRPADRLSLRRFSRVALYTPRVAIQELFHRFRMSLAPQVDDRGWYHVPEAEHWGLGPAEARGRLAVHESFMHEAYFGPNAAVLRRLLTTLRGRGVDVVFVTTPVWPTYQAGMRPELWNRARSTVEQLAREYGALYLSFLHEPRMRAEDFLDCDHLNAQGALRFTAILDASLRARDEAAARPTAEAAAAHAGELAP